MIQLFCNEYELDMPQFNIGDESSFFPITYQQADAREPEKRKRNVSKPFNLPGTKNNNKFFMSAYSIGISDVYGDGIGFEFDSSIRYPAFATKNGQVIFKGTLQLKKVITKSDFTNGIINEFRVLLFSDVADIFQALGDLKVSELGWSAYDHTLSVANIVASWTAGTGSGYWYPYIDYGFSQNPLSILTNQLRPFVYIKEIVEKCLAKGGYTLDSTFFNSTRIKKLAWGYGGGEPVLLTAAQVTARRAHYTGDGTASYNLPSTSYNGFITKFNHNKFIAVSDNTVVTMTQDVDPSAQYNESTGEITVANAGYYTLALSGTFPTTYTYSDITLTGQHIIININWNIAVNGAVISQTPYQITASAAGSDNAVFSISQTLDLSATDVVTSFFTISTLGSQVTEQAIGETLDITFDLNNTLDMDFTAINSGLVDGDTVEVARFLPAMKASDFLNDIITMFNLYVGDPDQDGVIVIEPEDSYFYGTDDTDVWTDKLERGADIEITNPVNIEGKTYKFMWAQDRDYYKQRYFDLYGHDYGDYDYNVPSTFKKGEKKYQLKMAQSVPVQIEGTDIIIPRIIKVNETTLVSQPHKGKPRIFFNNGTTSTTTTWDLVNSDTLSASNQNVYPIAHHLDSLTSATFDLNFGVPEIVYYTATTYTTANLFSTYHAQFIRELTGRDSKMIEAWFRLRETDFYENFMRRLCNIDGIVYKKNKVKDWIANGNTLVKVELIKKIEGNSVNTFSQDKPPIADNPMGPIIDPGDKITTDGTAKSYRQMYPIDTSSGDVTYTLDADNLIAGWEGYFKKTTSAGTVTLTTTGGGATGTDIDGNTSYSFTTQNKTIKVKFDGQYFYII